MKKRETEEERSAVAGMRSHVYGFLATVFRQELTSDFLQRVKDPQFLGVLAGLGVDWQAELVHRPEEALLEDLAVEYARLFLGPGEHISPHESIHHERDGGRWGQLWGDAAVEVKKMIETAGFRYHAEYKGMPDHISVELEFMAEVTQREAQAWEENDEEGALYCRKIEKRFVGAHLGKWIPQFCDKVTRQSELPFYGDMAALTKRFIELEEEELKG